MSGGVGGAELFRLPQIPIRYAWMRESPPEHYLTTTFTGGLLTEAAQRAGVR
jgi:hypothetical protein